MDLVSEKWFLHSLRNKLYWIRCDDPKINHPITETSVEAAEFSGHIKVMKIFCQCTRKHFFFTFEMIGNRLIASGPVQSLLIQCYSLLIIHYI